LFASSKRIASASSLVTLTPAKPEDEILPDISLGIFAEGMFRRRIDDMVAEIPKISISRRDRSR
jgi:hypothetical protein